MEKNKEKDIASLFDELIKKNSLRNSFIYEILEIYKDIKDINTKCKLDSPTEITDNYIKNKVKTIKEKKRTKYMIKIFFIKN